jgi:hypothetical protein
MQEGPRHSSCLLFSGAVQVIVKDGLGTRQAKEKEESLFPD